MRTIRRTLAFVIFVVVVSGCGSSNTTPVLHSLALTSSTVSNNGTIPVSMVYNNAACGSGSNQSPQLSWQNAPPLTKSFAIVMYDQTANFVHWGMYNIPPTVTNLPANAGVPTSPYPQISNDFGDMNYDGPCPPAGLAHQYSITIYAVSVSSFSFTDNPNLNPPSGATLLSALAGTTIQSASITAMYTLPASASGQSMERAK